MSYVSDHLNMTDDRARILEDRVEDLTREIARTINEAEIPERPGLRAELKDFAINLLQESVTSAESVVARPLPAEVVRFNPLGIAIPLSLAGVVLFFLFPPVGMLLLAGAAAMVVWGLLVSVVARG